MKTSVPAHSYVMLEELGLAVYNRQSLAQSVQVDADGYLHLEGGDWNVWRVEPAKKTEAVVDAPVAPEVDTAAVLRAIERLTRLLP